VVYVPAHHREEAREYDEELVEEKMGIPPSLIVDYKALSGDPSDNIPGVRGVGSCKAVQLLKAFGSVDGIYAALQEPGALTEEEKKLLSPKLVEKLADGHESAILSRQLATIDCKVPLQFVLDDCLVSGFNKAVTADLFNRLGFKSLMNLLPQDEFEKGVQEALF